MRAWGSVGHYLQGVGAIDGVRAQADRFGARHLYLMDSFVEGILGERIAGQYEEAPATIVYDGAAVRAEIAELDSRAHANGASYDVVVVVGGGKIIDVAKVIAADHDYALVVCPTIAASDAPASAMSILYDASGEMNEIALHVKNPDLVLVDTAIIASAPRRFLVSGIADALATYYEGVSNQHTGHPNYVWMDGANDMTVTARAVAQACRDTLLRDAPAALVACDANLTSPALENVVEANILMSGIGFENVGCSIAHAIGNALTAIPAIDHVSSHGERVGFSTVCLLVAEDYDPAEVDRVMRFCIECGIPVTLGQLGCEPTDEELARVAEAAIAGGTAEASPFHSTVQSLVELMRVADALGHKYLQA